MAEGNEFGSGLEEGEFGLEGRVEGSEVGIKVGPVVVGYGNDGLKGLE